MPVLATSISNTHKHEINFLGSQHKTKYHNCNVWDLNLKFHWLEPWDLKLDRIINLSLEIDIITFRDHESNTKIITTKSIQFYDPNIQNKLELKPISSNTKWSPITSRYRQIWRMLMQIRRHPNCKHDSTNGPQ
jgi:hypothetical protein